MTRSLFSGRYLIILLIVIIVLSKLVGAWDWQKRDHGCLGDDHFYLGAKVQWLEWGSLRLYNWPVLHDCPAIEQVPNSLLQTSTH